MSNGWLKTAVFDLVLNLKVSKLKTNLQWTSVVYLVSLGDGVLDACCGLHVVRHGLIHRRGRSRGQDAMLENLRVASEAPLLGRKNRFLILQSPLHYELILGGAERPADKEHMDPISHWQASVRLSEYIKSASWFHSILCWGAYGSHFLFFFTSTVNLWIYTVPASHFGCLAWEENYSMVSDHIANETLNAFSCTKTPEGWQRSMGPYWFTNFW